MKISIKLDRDELKGLLTILEIMEHMPIEGDLVRYIFSSEAGKMKDTIIQRMIYNPAKKSFKISLTNLQTIICFGLMKQYAFDLMPFEKAISLRIINDIQRQYDQHQQIMLNFSHQIN